MPVIGAESPRQSFTRHWSRVTKISIQYGRSYTCVCGSSNFFESWRSIFGYLHVLRMDIGGSRPYVQHTARNDRQSLARSILTPIIIFADRRNTDFLTKASKKVHRHLRTHSYGDTRSAELLFSRFLDLPCIVRTLLTSSDISR